MKVSYNITEIEGIIAKLQEKLEEISRVYGVLESEINAIASCWSSPASSVFIKKLINLISLDFSDYYLLIEGLTATNKLFEEAKDKVSSASKKIGV